MKKKKTLPVTYSKEATVKVGHVHLQTGGCYTHGVTDELQMMQGFSGAASVSCSRASPHEMSGYPKLGHPTGQELSRIFVWRLIMITPGNYIKTGYKRMQVHMCWMCCVHNKEYTCTGLVTEHISKYSAQCQRLTQSYMFWYQTHFDCDFRQLTALTWYKRSFCYPQNLSPLKRNTHDAGLLVLVAVMYSMPDMQRISIAWSMI